MKRDAIESTTDLQLTLHTVDGQSPFKLGQKLRIVVTDE